MEFISALEFTFSSQHILFLYLYLLSVWGKQAVMSNTLIDNIFLADKKRTRQDWSDSIAELMHRIRAMDTNDLNEWITWFSNVIRKLNEDERGELITQLKVGR